MLAFFAVDGAAHGVAKQPPGHGSILDADMNPLRRIERRLACAVGHQFDAAKQPASAQIAALFALGFALAAPVVACLLLVELALGVVARNLPQINMFVIGIPVKIVVGLGMLSLWFAGMGDAMSRVHAFMFRSWHAAFAAAPLAGAR